MNLLTPAQLAQSGAPALDMGSNQTPAASNVTAPSMLDSAPPVPFPEIGGVLSPVAFDQPATANPPEIVQAIRAAEGKSPSSFLSKYFNTQSAVAVILGLILITAGIFQFKPAQRIVAGATGA